LLGLDCKAILPLVCGIPLMKQAAGSRSPRLPAAFPYDRFRAQSRHSSSLCAFSASNLERWRSVAYFGRLDGAIVELNRRRIHILPGTYHPEALRPLSDALFNVAEEIRTALVSFQTEAAAYNGRAGQ
jgi:hypothetical protein